MAKTVSFDFKNVAGMASAEDIAAIKEEVVAAKSTLVNKTGEGNDFLGFRCSGSYRYRRFLPWCKSSDRSFKTQLL